MELYTAFIIGLVGSLHCIGMCGPIAIMLPAGTSKGLTFLAGRVLYNTGRIITYALMGMVLGYIGNKVALWGFQQSLSILFGILILAAFIIPAGYLTRLDSFLSLNKLFRSIKNQISSLFRKKSNSSFILIGLLNGLLPCGLVYLALGTAASTGSALMGAFAMLLFGLGTMPVMLAVSSFYKIIPDALRIKAAKFVPVFAIILAVIFILRGLSLGIPYISPSLNKMAVHQVECKH